MSWSNYQKAVLRTLGGIQKKTAAKRKHFWIKMQLDESGADTETFEKILLENTEVGKVYKSGAVKCLVIDDVLIEIEGSIAPANTIKYEYQIVTQEKTAMVYIDDQVNLLKWALEYDDVGTSANLERRPLILSLKNSLNFNGGILPEGGCVYWRNQLWHGIDSDNTSATIKYHIIWICHYEIWNPIQLKNFGDAIA